MNSISIIKYYIDDLDIAVGQELDILFEWDKCVLVNPLLDELYENNVKKISGARITVKYCGIASDDLKIFTFNYSKILRKLKIDKIVH